MYCSALRVTIAAVCTLLCSTALASNLTISQVDWLQGSGGFLAQNSEWGVAELQFGPSDEGLFYPDGSGGYYGYLQVLTSANAGASPNNWAVQNKIMVFKDPSAFDGRLPDSMTFNLGVPRGDDLSGSTTYRADVIVTALPLTDMPVVNISDNKYAITVGKVEWVFGGGALADTNVSDSFFGEAGRVAPATAVNYVSAVVKDNEHILPTQGMIKLAEDKIAKVQEELQGCGPGSAARSFRYLADTKVIMFDKTAQEIYAALKVREYMNTSLGAAGTGTLGNVYAGAQNRYAEGNGLKLEDGEGSCSADLAAGFLKDGDVEQIFFSFGVDNDGKDLGGHFAFVAAVAYEPSDTAKGFEVNVIDTMDQKADSPTADAHWYTFDKDGKLLSGANAGKDKSGKCQAFFHLRISE